MPSPTNEYDEMDTEAIAADIGESLFGKKADDGLGKGETVNEEVVEPPAGESPAETTPPVGAKGTAETPATPPIDAPAIVPGVNSETAPLPKAWKKEMAPEWEKASPALKQYVNEREAQVMRGINQYAGDSQAWNNLIKPFVPVLEANPGVNPIILMQGLMATHLQLLNPAVPAADKTAMVKKLLAEYNIALEPGSGPAPDAILVSRLQKTEEQLAELRRDQQVSKKVAYDSGLAEHTKAVEKFAADPKNKYFNDVANDILRFINTGTASDLAGAYELACWANPAVRAKRLADQQADEKAAAAQKRDKTGKFVNLDGETGEKPKGKPKSINDTVDEVIAKHYGATTH